MASTQRVPYFVKLQNASENGASITSICWLKGNDDRWQTIDQPDIFVAPGNHTEIEITFDEVIGEQIFLKTGFRFQLGVAWSEPKFTSQVQVENCQPNGISNITIVDFR